MTYAQKLKDPRWQKMRLQILERDEWTCQWCGDTTNTLHVHHSAYEGKEPWDVEPELLTTICQDCHSVNHLKLTELERYLIGCVRQRDYGNMEMQKTLNHIVRAMKSPS